MLIGLLHLAHVTLDWNDELRKHCEYLAGVSLHELLGALHGQELVGFFGLPESLEENGQIEVVVEVFGLQFPGELG